MLTTVVVDGVRERAPGYVAYPFIGLLSLDAQDDYRADPLSWAPADGAGADPIAFAKEHAPVAEAVRAGMKRGRTSGQAGRFRWSPLR